MPPITGLSTLPIFTNSGGPSAMLLSQSTALAMGNVEVANQSATTDQWSLPPKLTKKTLELEYIEMSELLPESWRLQQEDEQCCHHRRLQSRRGPVSDILMWLECYATMVAVLSTKFLHKMPHLMAYQQTILKAHRSYVGEGWIVYDSCYRRRASVTKYWTGV